MSLYRFQKSKNSYLITIRIFKKQNFHVIQSIDINADVGEGYKSDAQIMNLISSCSIACGGHYGNDESIRNSIQLATKYDVKIGAHPSFPDKDNFGRIRVYMTKEELKKSIITQLSRFYRIADSLNSEINHIKLHGALYNYAMHDAATSDAVIEAILALKRRLQLYVQHGSVLHGKAANLLPLQFEAFIDRRYTDNGELVGRAEENAIIDSPQDAWDQLNMMINSHTVVTETGKSLPIVASTFCIHGDHPNSIEILNHIHKNLSLLNIGLK